ncbi:IS4 family transposase [Deinococcus marmoris]
MHTNAALTDLDTFVAFLKERLPHHRIDLLRRVAAVIFGIVQAETTRHRKIAIHLRSTATLDSRTKTVARTFHDAGLSEQDVQDILLPLLPDGKLIFVMDRTNWKHGQADINILALGVLLGDVVIPLVHEVLPHGGNSHSELRIALVSRLLKSVPAGRWRVLIADREFVGKAWFEFLHQKRIKRCIRIKETTRMDELLVREQDKNLCPGQVRGLMEKAWVYGSLMQVVATLSPQGERVIVASDLPLYDVLQVYRMRWGIECTFSGMKSRGLGLEDTHMTAPDRIGRLFLLLSLAYAWMVRIGAWRADALPIAVKAHGRRAMSLAQYGWDLLCDALRWQRPLFQTFLALLMIAFPSPSQPESESVRY